MYAFPDGMQVLQALSRNQVPLPAAVIFNVGLPAMDGYTFARALRHHDTFQATPILLVTGHTGTFDKLRGWLVGANASVANPFPPAQVLAVLQSHLGTA